MPDKKLTDVTDNNVGKMTDNEIVKALKCCATAPFCSDKTGCPYKGVEDCVKRHTLDALDLINCLQAENERYKKYYFAHEYDKWEKELKAEVYKEIKERLEPLKQFRCCMLGNEYELSVTMREIDNLLKEMVGDK